MQQPGFTNLGIEQSLNKCLMDIINEYTASI